MVNFIFLGDSNWFFRDTSYDAFPWNVLYPKQHVASFTAQHLQVPCHGFPLYQLDISEDNTIRLQSLIQAFAIQQQPVSLILWIGQNTTWSMATSQHAHTDEAKCKERIHVKVQQFVHSINLLGRFDTIYVVEYHDHPNMRDNLLYQMLNQYLIDTPIDNLPEAQRITMIDTTPDMYVDGTHLSRSSQEAIAQHIACQIQS